MRKIHTRGLFNVTYQGCTVGKIKDVGWGCTCKLTFTPGAREPLKFHAEHADLVMLSSDAGEHGGGLRLMVIPIINGQPQQEAYVPCKLRGDLVLKSSDDIHFKVTFKHADLADAGLILDTLMSASLNLECSMGNQPSLSESTEEKK